jgi:hypothetical protein
MPVVITSVEPDVAPANGNTLIKVTGSGFTGVTDGTFAGNFLAFQSLTVVSDTSLTFRTIGANEGTYDLVINQPGGGTVTKTNAVKLVGAIGLHEAMGNRVREVASVTGTGAIGLTGAYSSSHVRFRTKCPEFSIVKYMIVNSNGEYEVGIGTFSTGPTLDGLTRDFIEESSNGNAIVSFSSGTKDIILCETAGSVNAGMEYRNILENASMTFWQRQAPATEKSLADGEYGPDRWYVLSQTANVGAFRTAASRPYLYQANAAVIKQTNATAQRIGIAQRVWSHESIGLRGKYARIQASFYSNKSTGAAIDIRWAVLEWTGTADSVTRDPVLSWTSTTYTPGNFFLSSNYNVIGTGLLTLPVGVNSGSISAITQNPFGQSLNNIVVMFWTGGTVAQNQELRVFAPMLIDDVYPRQWKKPNRTDELMRCLASYAKSFLLESNPATAAFAGARQYIATTAINGQEVVDFRVEMRKTPTVNVFSPQTGTAGKCYQYPAAADLNMGTEIVSTNGFWVYATPASTQAVRYQWTADADQ